MLLQMAFFFKFYFLLLEAELNARTVTDKRAHQETLRVGKWGCGRCHLFTGNCRGS